MKIVEKRIKRLTAKITSLPVEYYVGSNADALLVRFYFLSHDLPSRRPLHFQWIVAPMENSIFLEKYPGA